MNSKRKTLFENNKIKTRSLAALVFVGHPLKAPTFLFEAPQNLIFN